MKETSDGDNTGLIWYALIQYIRKNIKRSMPMNIIKLHHICIQTACYDDSLKFYRDLLGFEVVRDDLYAPKRLHRTWLTRGPITIELLSEKCNKPYGDYSNALQGMPHMSFLVADIHAAYEEAVRFGANIKTRHKKAIYGIKGGKQFKLIAPEGTEIEIRDTEYV